MNILKLMKLLYLSERLSFEKFHTPIIADKIFAMRNGPVLSKTLDIINMGSEHKSDWSKFISDREGHDVLIKPNDEITSINDLKNLNNNDHEILKSIWDKFGQKSQWDLVEYTHQYCPEWKDPNGSAQIISHQELFNVLGLTDIESASILSNLEC